MTLRRRLSIFSFSLLLLLCGVGATGIGTLLVARKLLANPQVPIFFHRFRLDDALVLLSGLTLLGVVMAVAQALSAQTTIARRLRHFQLPPGGAPSALNERAGDELDTAAREINELTALIAQLRAKQRSEDEVLAAK